MGAFDFIETSAVCSAATTHVLAVVATYVFSAVTTNVLAAARAASGAFFPQQVRKLRAWYWGRVGLGWTKLKS